MRLNLIFIKCTILLVSLVQGEDIEGRYIVLFDPHDRAPFESDVNSITELFVGRYGENEVLQEFEQVGYGIEAKLDKVTLQKVKNLPNVDGVFPVQRVEAFETQSDATWGLARISQRKTLEEPPYDYEYDSDDGKDVYVYVLDTGINIDHEEFEDRASWGVSTIKGATDQDLHGHGTHCAGIIAGSTFGVAKNAHVIAVKVLDDNGKGSDASTIAGLDFVLTDRPNVEKKIVSMSLGGKTSVPLDRAVREIQEQGLIIIVAAGNSNKDACKVSPARSDSVITVGATDIEDKKASFSNYGKCVDMLAPGEDIPSAWIDSNTDAAILSGTSMACPFVSGTAASLLSRGIPADKIRNTLLTLATNNTIKGFDKDTPNVFVFNGHSN